MGKNLKGKEIGKGICQRKDGKYAARYTAKDGSRREKHFDTLPEARNWLADAQYEDKYDVHNPSSEMTVDSWFEFWITNLIADLAPNTKRNYRERYRMNIQPSIGSMRMCDEGKIKRFCMHALRHTYATRAIESGVMPKVLQKLLGHLSSKTTMDRYVHVTDESLNNDIKQFEQNTILAS